jgi:hypothetical protein
MSPVTSIADIRHRLKERLDAMPPHTNCTNTEPKRMRVGWLFALVIGGVLVAVLKGW